MANIKSAKKRIKVIARKTLENKMVRSRTKTSIKKVVSAVSAGDKDAAFECLKTAVSDIDKAAKKGIYHKNNAARKKSRLTKLVSSI